MTRLALLIAMALLGIGLLLAQNSQSTKPLSDQSNSSNVSPQQSSEPATPSKERQAGTAPDHQAGQQRKGDPAHQGLPDAAVRDEQSSTPATTGAAGQDSNPASPSTMGTTGGTPGASEPPQQQAAPQSGTPDQQPNPSTQPDATTPHADLLQTPASRAVATHTPDPGTCMNPAALQTSADGTAAPPPCR